MTDEAPNRSGRCDPPRGGPSQHGDLVGFDLLSDAQNLGELEEVIDLNGRPYFLLDSRHWSFGSKRLLPVEAVEAIAVDERTATTPLGAEHIRAAPDFDPFHLLDPAYATQLEEHYEPERQCASN